MKRLCAFAVCLLIGTGSADAGQKVYAGDEAVALRCANMIALTGVALGAAELISPAETEVMLILSVLILDRHVSGTRAQKMKALEAMKDRRTPEETLEDYRDHVQQCLERFPIN